MAALGGAAPIKGGIVRTAQKKSIVVTAAFALLAALVPVASSASPVHAVGPPVFINEIHYDDAGADAGEGVEIAGPAGTDLTDWTVVPYNGNGGTTYSIKTLTETIPDQQAGFGTVVVEVSGLQNGAPDGVALVDAGGTVIEFLSYEGAFTATNGPASGVTSVDIGVAETGATVDGTSLQLVGNGTEGGDFSWAASQPSTFGAINTGQSFGTGSPLTVDCGAPLVTDEGVAATTTISAVDADDEIVSLRLVSDDVLPAGRVTEGVSDLPAGVGLTATLEIDVDGLAVIGSYSATVEAVNASGNVLTCDLSIEVESTVVVITPIHEVQGAGADSPFDGASVVVEGVVVSDFQVGAVGTAGDLRGFHVQEEDADADADAATSEGIFVYDGFSPAVDVAVGDLVQVEGVVDEFFGLTELTDVEVTVLSSGNALPTPGAPVLPVTSSDDFEALEGMRVTFDQDLVISESYAFAQYNELLLTSQRYLTPTAEIEPGPAVAAANAAFALDSVTLDDARTTQNSDPARHPNGGVFDLDNLFRNGDTLSNVTGVVDYSFGKYRIQPTQGAVHNETNPRTAAPDPVGGSMQVATFNVLNYFTTLDGNGDICGPAADQECRGADDADELERQRSKILAAMAAVDADVFGLMEIENNAGDGPTADLVAGLNDLAGAGTYDYVATGAIGTDAIRQAIIYQPASVTPVGAFAVLDASVDPRFDDEKNRPALAQSFEENATGAIVTIAINHFKSKGSNCDSLGDPDTGDGSGNCNLTRAAAASALVDWLAGDPTDSGDSDMLIIGDLNSYDKEQPIDVLRANGYRDLVFDFVGEDAYSYVFGGQYGYLDHQLANESLAPQVTGTTVWHINADEPPILDYDTFYKQPAQDAIFAADPYRSSDHDPVVVGLDLALTSRQAKAQVIDDLTAALGSGSSHSRHGWFGWYFNDDRYIQRAIDHIEDSLKSTYWEDDGDHLTSKGAKVFDAERRAVGELQRVWGSARPAARAAIAALIAVDHDLARTELDEAIARGGDSRDIARAEWAMNVAERFEAWGLPGFAIWQYKVAWEYARRSVRNLVDLQLLGINDYHGHLEASTPGNVDGTPAGGAEYLSAKLTELRAGNDHSLTVAAGDLIGGSPAFSGLFHDEPSVESLNAMHLDVSSVGNHEFDEGVTELLRMQHGGCHPVDGCYFTDDPFGGADFKWLAANVVDESTGETALPGYEIKTVDGIKVAFIGMTLEATDTLVAASGIAGWDFLDEAETANALVPILKRQGVEAMVVLLHEGGSQTPPPGAIDSCVGISGPVVAINDALDPEIDAMITGHTHLPYNCMLADSDGVPRLVTSAYSFGRVVSELNLVLDKQTRDVRRELSTATNHLVDQAKLAPDPVQTAVIAKWQPLFDGAGNDPVGSISEDIVRGGTPPGADRGVESAVGNLVADAQLWSTSANGADIAFMNPGGLRSDLLFAQSGAEGDGVVTYGEAFTMQPFGNSLVTYVMTGAEIISVLEEQCQPIGSSRPFLHLGVSEGFTYDLSTTIAGGDCTAITVSNVELNGAALDPAGEYSVTVNNFLADGGDNFTTLGEVATARLDGGNDLTAFINYMQAFSPLVPPSTDRVNEL